MKEKCVDAVNKLKSTFDDRPKIGIVMGSGLGGLVDALQNAVRIRFEDIPNFPISSVDGHRGEVVSGRLSGVSICVLSGRIHYYEGYTMQQVVFPIRVLAVFGVQTLMITNAAGAVNESYKAGDIVTIRDHINLMGDNPLSGDTHFADLSEAYSGELRSLARIAAGKLGMTYRSGVYAAISGPAYETPAEIKALRRMGADLVGMSTVPEVIMANHLGMNVLGLSMVTNMAAGISGKPLSHQEVIAVSKNASPKLNTLLKGFVKHLNDKPERQPFR